MTEGERLAAAAARFIGSPFRLHGRNPETGLDCIGLVLASLEAIGRKIADPRGYRLRNVAIDGWLPFAAKCGLIEAEGSATTGDVLLLKPSSVQHHLAIVADESTIIHAHAGLRRVVRQPLDGATTIIEHWRLAPPHGDTQWRP